MTQVTGSCPECGGAVLRLDPEADRVLHRIFGATMAEHRPGCPQNPDEILPPGTELDDL